jgi:hypothetical protein
MPSIFDAIALGQTNFYQTENINTLCQECLLYCLLDLREREVSHGKTGRDN